VSSKISVLASVSSRYRSRDERESRSSIMDNSKQWALKEIRTTDGLDDYIFENVPGTGFLASFYHHPNPDRSKQDHECGRLVLGGWNIAFPEILFELADPASKIISPGRWVGTSGATRMYLLEPASYFGFGEICYHWWWIGNTVVLGKPPYFNFSKFQGPPASIFSFNN